ncbi:EscF/YscF/HrpA family type III secretion system needle major subunit [Kistimonas asteriae]|uniref:EscF/YscF/HrpA family type III secretion system needle major subunit n=1 Tax=Kistimonas asteriae TaxID=517724 RepID=UPI001BA863D9|nr:EscF/YscF/HrpA family type III secretion system needle major subunit [Kistimonas asteriae]
MSILNNGTNSISFDQATDRLSNKLSEFESKLEKSMQDLDPSNLADMIKLQQDVNKLTMLYSVDSSVVKAVKDTAQGIIQKIN